MPLLPSYAVCRALGDHHDYHLLLVMAMSSSTLPELHIRPHTKRNALVISVVGAGLILLTLALHALLQLPAALFMLGFIAGLALLGLGIAKKTEPETSILISPERISYRQRRGQWSVPWDSIQRFDIPRIERNLEWKDTPFVGIRLNDYAPLLSSLSPRLAVYLLMEQRPLLVTALRFAAIEPDDYSRYFESPSRWKSETGEIYQGISAAFAFRMSCYRELLGYDLFIHETALDRDPEDFVLYLKELQNTRQQVLQQANHDSTPPHN